MHLVGPTRQRGRGQRSALHLTNTQVAYFLKMMTRGFPVGAAALISL